MHTFKILVTTDGSNLSDKAVEVAAQLAEQFAGVLVGVTVVSSSQTPEEMAVAQERLDHISAVAKEHSVACEVVSEISDSVAAGILRAASRSDAYCVVMASRGLGTLGALLLGSETQQVLSEADRPVLVVR